MLFVDDSSVNYDFRILARVMHKLFLRLNHNLVGSNEHIWFIHLLNNREILLIQILDTQLMGSLKIQALVFPLDIFLIVVLMSHLLMVIFHLLFGCCFLTALFVAWLPRFAAIFVLNSILHPSLAISWAHRKGLVATGSFLHFLCLWGLLLLSLKRQHYLFTQHLDLILALSHQVLSLIFGKSGNHQPILIPKVILMVQLVMRSDLGKSFIFWHLCACIDEWLAQHSFVIFDDGFASLRFLAFLAFLVLR